MKTIKNKVTEIDKGEGVKMKYSELAESCVNHPPQGGYSVTEMKDRLNLLGKLDHDKEVIKLEDAEADKLVECVKAMPWGRMHKDIVAFSDAVDKMK